MPGSCNSTSGRMVTMVSAPCAAMARRRRQAEYRTGFLKTITEVNKRLVIVLRTSVVNGPARPQNVMIANQVIERRGSEFGARLGSKRGMESLHTSLHIEAKLVGELAAQSHRTI